MVDSAKVFESINRGFAAQRAMVDSAVIFESINRGFAAQKAMVDSAKVFESINRGLAAQRAMVDSAKVFESINQRLAAQRALLFDSAAVFDSLNWVARSPLDPATLEKIGEVLANDTEGVSFDDAVAGLTEFVINQDSDAASLVSEFESELRTEGLQSDEAHSLAFLTYGLFLAGWAVLAGLTIPLAEVQCGWVIALGLTLSWFAIRPREPPS
jgi:hypothetical protein